MSEFPESLVRLTDPLERAIERDIRRRRRHPLAVRAAVATAIAAAFAAGLVAVRPDEDAAVGPPAAAPPYERAAAVLGPDGPSVVHEVAITGGVRVETWRATTKPYAQRQVITRADGTRLETATTGDGTVHLFDGRTIYTNGAALGTPMPAGDGDPLREQVVQRLRSGDVRTTERGRTIRFSFEDAGVVTWSYVVDARTYAPMRITTASEGVRSTTRFERYDTLPATERTRALLDLRAQHPDAAVDATRSGYREAQARLGG